MTAPLTLCFFQIGKTRSYMNLRPLLQLLVSFRLKTILPLLPTKLLNLAHGHKVSYGAHERHFGTSPNWSSIMRMMSFPRSVKQAGPCWFMIYAAPYLMGNANPS